jgi:hypothetical protein
MATMGATTKMVLVIGLATQRVRTKNIFFYFFAYFSLIIENIFLVNFRFSCKTHPKKKKKKILTTILHGPMQDY